MSDYAYCVTDLQKAIDCVASNTDSCRNCLPTDKFAEVFPEQLEEHFRTTLAFVPPAQQGFCNEANSRVCAYQEQSLTCCCQKETNNFIQCAFNNVYLRKYGVLEPCSQSCGAEENGGGGSLVLIIVVVATLLIFIGFCSFMYYRKRPGASGKNEKTLSLQKHGHSDVITASFVTDKTDAQRELLSVEQDIELGVSSRGNADSAEIAGKQNAVKNGRQLSEQTQALRGDATTGRIRPSTMSKPSESSFVAESEGGLPKKPKKKKKAKAPGRVSSNSIKGSLAQHVHSPEQDEEHSTSTKDMEAEILRAEREAKILRSEQRDVLAGTRLEKKGMSKEKKGMSKALKKLEREREEMVQIIAQLEDEKYGAENEPYGYGDEYDTMASPIGFIDDVNSESGDEYAINSCRDDNAAGAGWLGSNGMSRRSGPTHELRQRDPNPIRNVSRSRSSERMQSTGRVDSLALSTRSEQVGRSRSSERMNLQVSRSRSSERMKSSGMDPLSLSARSEHVGRSRSSERMNLQPSRSRSSERMNSTGMDPLSFSSRSEHVGRSRSSERMNLQASRSRSSERMNLQGSRSRSSERMESTGMDPLCLSARSEHDHHRETRELHKHKTRSTKDRPLNIDDYYAKKQRSTSSERSFGSERSEGRSVRRTKSAEKMLLSQSMHGDPDCIRSRARAEILMSRSEHGNIGRRQKLSRATSERPLPRMEPPQTGLTGTNSDTRSAREAPSQRMVRRTHSGDNLVKVKRYY